MWLGLFLACRGERYLDTGQIRACAQYKHICGKIKEVFKKPSYLGW
jgi:hypothetical protein